MVEFDLGGVEGRGNRQEVAVRPMGERRERNPEMDEAPLHKPPAETRPSKRVYLKQSVFDAHGLTQGCSGCRAMQEGIPGQGHSAVCRARMEELLQGTPKGQQRLEEAERRTRDTAGERAAKRIKLQFADRPVNPESFSSANPASSNSTSPSDAIAGGDAASASNVVRCRGWSGEADGRRTSLFEKEDDEERVKRQRTEKKTELEMEVSNVAKIDDSRRILDLRRDGWELEDINHRDAAMFCACEMPPRVILTRCTKRTQLESTRDLCRAQGAQGLGFVCEFVGNIADDPMTKNIQNSTGPNDTVICESLSGTSMSVISNVDNIRRPVQRAMKETGHLNSQDIDTVVEDSLEEEGEEMVADDAKKGSIPI